MVFSVYYKRRCIWDFCVFDDFDSRKDETFRRQLVRGLLLLAVGRVEYFESLWGIHLNLASFRAACPDRVLIGSKKFKEEEKKFCASEGHQKDPGSSPANVSDPSKKEKKKTLSNIRKSNL